MSKMNRFMKQAIPIAVVCFFGCRDESTSPNSLTKSDLRYIGMTLSRYSINDCEKCHLWGEFLDYGIKNSLIESERQRRDFETDHWGTPYAIRIDRSIDNMVIRVISCGQNKKLEEGKGDDLTCNIRITNGGNNSYWLETSQE